jgi:hypothetical protein
LLSSCLKAFHDNPEIKERYKASIVAGHGSPEHILEPTLKILNPTLLGGFRITKPKIKILYLIAIKKPERSFLASSGVVKYWG